MEGTRTAWLRDDGFNHTKREGSTSRPSPAAVSICFSMRNLTSQASAQNLSELRQEPSIAALNRSARTVARSGWPASCRIMSKTLPVNFSEARNPSSTAEVLTQGPRFYSPLPLNQLHGRVRQGRTRDVDTDCDSALRYAHSPNQHGNNAPCICRYSLEYCSIVMIS